MKEKMKFFKNFSEKFKSLDESKKKKILISGIAIVVIIILAIIIAIVSSKIGAADKKSGNLKNDGFATGKGNTAYISTSVITASNEATKGLLEVTPKNTTKVIDESEYVKSVNLYKGKLYYLAINKTSTGKYTRQVVKINLNGENREVLVDNIETTSIGNDTLNISDGWIYFLNGDSELEKVKISNTDKRQPVSKEEKISYFQISGKYIYYITADDEFKRMKKDGSSEEKISNGIEKFQVVADEVYYISKSDKSLMKFDLNGNDRKETKVIERKVQAFNIYEKTIYYAVNEENDGGEQALYKMKLNGKKNEKIVDLSSANVVIGISGKWIYYTDKVDDSPYYYAIYRVQADGKNKEKVNI